MQNHEPITMSVADAVKWCGLSRSEVYRRLAAGDIAAIKNRSRTLVITESLRAFLGTLPPAAFRAPAI